MGKNKIDRTCIREIAAKVGVSTATVSRVFNRHPYVSDSVRERVIDVAHRMGYAPTIASTNKSFGVTVGFFNEIRINTYLEQLISLISNKFFELGYNVQLISGGSFPYILRNTFSGVIVFSADDANFFRELQIPCVSINNPAEGVCNVFTDHLESLKLATEYLLKLGHKRIAFLHANLNSWGTQERLKGFHETLSLAGIPLNEQFAEPFLRESQDIPDGIAKLLHHKPTALIVEGETNGLIANHSLVQLGLKIPQDISLITFENHLVSKYQLPPNTTVCQDFEALAHNAVEILLRTVSNSAKKTVMQENLVLHNRIIERQSCTRCLSLLD